VSETKPQPPARTHTEQTPTPTRSRVRIESELLIWSSVSRFYQGSCYDGGIYFLRSC